MGKYIETIIEWKAYNQASEIPVDNNTNSLMVINRGSVVAYINGMPLNVNEMWGDSRNANEVITGKFYITFDAGAGPLLHVQLTRYK